jgi:hypothetical protein
MRQRARAALWTTSSTPQRCGPGAGCAPVYAHSSWSRSNAPAPRRGFMRARSSPSTNPQVDSESSSEHAGRATKSSGRCTPHGGSSLVSILLGTHRPAAPPLVCFCAPPGRVRPGSTVPRSGTNRLHDGPRLGSGTGAAGSHRGGTGTVVTHRCASVVRSAFHSPPSGADPSATRGAGPPDPRVRPRHGWRGEEPKER